MRTPTSRAGWLAARELARSVSTHDPRTRLVSNRDGQVVHDGDEVVSRIVGQIASPVRWVDCVQTLVEQGVDRALELGPGRVLGGLIRKTSPDVETIAADSLQALEAVPAQGAPDGA